MILTGILRHYLTTLLQTAPKPPTPQKLRETRALHHAQLLRTQNPQIPRASFERRKETFITGAHAGAFLAGGPEAREKGKPNPLSDPAMMEGMMGAMKGNVAMMVPQSLIMGWINAFFAGYVISTSFLQPFHTAAFVSWGRPSIMKDRDSHVGIWTPFADRGAFDSETPISPDSPVQANAPSRRWYPRPRRPMGLEPVLVLPYTLRPTTGLQLYSRL